MLKLSTLVAIPITLSVLLTIYHFARFNDLALEISSVSSSLRMFQDTTRQNADHTVLVSRQSNIQHKNSCVITVAAWRKYGHVQTLYDSVQTNSPTIRCFVWFVADSVFHSITDGSSEAIASIKKRIEGRFDIVTVDTMSETMSDLDFVRRLTFSKEFTEDQFTAFLTPFALQYTLRQYDPIDSVIYLDKHLWVNNTLEYVQMKLNTQSFTMGPSRSEDPHLGVMALSKHSPTAIQFLATWINDLRIQGMKPLHVIGIFEEEDWQEFYDRPSQTTYWNLYLPQEQSIDETEKKRSKPVLFIDFTNTTTSAKSIQHSSIIDKYRQLLQKYDASYYEQLYFGFNYFSDGTMIDSWMRNLYEAMLEPVQEHEDGTLLFSLNSYTRIDFQDRVYKDPFLAALSKKESLSSGQLTFLEWLLRGPSSLAVDMEGKFYFSDVEDNVWKSLSYYPVDHAVSNPLGDDVHLYKFWFEHLAQHNGWISKQLHQKVLANTAHHRANHALYHKSAASRLDLGLNVIGWHAGLFGIGKTALKMYQAAAFVGLGANAIEVRPVSVQTFAHPRALPFKLSRSCSQQVNLVMVNADYTLFTKQEIPDLIWNHKYNIGYWEWELDIFPKDWMANLEYYDEIWVPSRFTADSITHSEGYDGTPVKVLPLPLTTDAESTKGKKLRISSNESNSTTTGRLQLFLEPLKDAFVFIIVFDFHSHKQRKNPYASIRAFLDAFPLQSDERHRYHLIVKSHHGSSADIGKMKTIANNDPRLHFLSDILSDDEHRALQDRADCYVSLHRSEGYGMNILEEMGHGVPVIATNYSGNVDFFLPLQKFLGSCIFAIPYKLVNLTVSYGPYKEGNRWADPDHISAVRAMREVVKNNCKKEVGTEISQLVISNFGMKAVGEKIRSLLFESWETIREKEKKVMMAYDANEKGVRIAYDIAVVE